MNQIFNNILKDIRIDLTEEFDRNFERKGFFDRPWKKTKLQNNRGTLMMRSGALRRSIKSNLSGESITWSSSLPYASIHNEGGKIHVTAKMKSFFWAMYYKSAGAIGKGNNARNQRLNIEAQQWKALALMKIGAEIKIEKRQFIGAHPMITGRIQNIMDHNLKDLEDFITKKLRR